MDLKKEIVEIGFKDDINPIIHYIGDRPERFAALMDMFFSKDLRVCQRAAWVASHCIDRNTELINPHLDALVANLENPAHDAIKRNTMRILAKIDIPEHLWEDCLNYGFQYLESGSEAIAVKAHAMYVVYNLSEKIPEIKNELKLLIEDMMPYSSAGIKSRGRKILAKL